MINFSKLFQICNRDLQQIVVFDEFDQSIQLNGLFLEQILCGILEINQNIELKSKFDEILIVNPHESIDDFIDDHQELFVCNGWTLKKTSYEDKKWNRTSNNVLSIAQL